MRDERETHRFPHTRYTTALPPSKRNAFTLWNELVNFLAHKYLDPNKWGWAFRGVSTVDYWLESKLEREVKNRNLQKTKTKSDRNIDGRTAEHYLISQFKRAAHHFAEPSMLPRQHDTLEWLALMQHYGVPTRLLDFTRSPYVACFFALKHADVNGDCAIWAIDTNWIVKKCVSLVKKSLSHIEPSFAGHHGLTWHDLLNSEFILQHFDLLFMENSVPMILPIVPSRSNARLLIQQGLFLCPSAGDKGFEENLLSYAKAEKGMQDHVHRIVIEGRIRTEVLSELHYMNISQASLFPSLEGFATSLAHELGYKSPDEIEWSR